MYSVTAIETYVFNVSENGKLKKKPNYFLIITFFRGELTNLLLRALIFRLERITRALYPTNRHMGRRVIYRAAPSRIIKAIIVLRS